MSRKFTIKVAGALKWNGWYVFRQLGNEQQRWEFGQWVPVPDPHKTIDEMATASPAQIIAANVPEQDIPACQIEGVRAERGKQIASPSSPSPESGTPFDETTWPIGAFVRHIESKNYMQSAAVVFGKGVGIIYGDGAIHEKYWDLLARDFEYTTDNGKSWHRCIVESLNGATPQQIIAASSPSPERDAPTWPDGTPISKAEYIYALESTGVPASEIEIRQSPSPESGSCQCEAANTLRDLIEAFDGWNDAKTHASLTEGYQSLRRKFELARESLNAGTEAAA